MCATTKTRGGQSRPTKTRSGYVSVELAIVAPVLFMLMFGVIELARIQMIRSALATASYEGCRAGIVPGATSEQVTQAVRRVLAASLVSGEKIRVESGNDGGTSKTISVTITVHVISNRWIFSRFFGFETLSRTCVLDLEKAVK